MQQKPLDIPKALLAIIESLETQGFRAIIVGGFVRDALLGIKSKDIDIEVFGCNNPDLLLKHLKAFGAAKMIGKHFGIIKLIDKAYTYEFALPRLELKTGLKHQDFHVDFIPEAPFKRAASRRDFSINSIGYDPKKKQFLDPFQGRKDLKLKRLVHNSDAFCEDPLRVLRALQFAARFELGIASSTKKVCKTLSLSHLSLERIEAEFEKLVLVANKPSFGLKYFFDLGLETYFFKHHTLSKTTWLKQLLFIDHLKKDIDSFNPLSQKTLLLTGLFWVSHLSLRPKMPFTKQNIKQHPAYLMITLVCKKKTCLTHIQHILIALFHILEKKTLNKHQSASIIYDLQKQECLKNTLYFINTLAHYSNIKMLKIFITHSSSLTIKKSYRSKGNDLIKQGIIPGPQLKKALKEAHIAEMLA